MVKLIIYLNNKNKKKMKNSDKIYVVIAYRFNDDNMHSYLVGCNTKKHKAIEIAMNENEYRGGKYQCRIYETDMNWTWNENVEHKKK